MEPFVPVLAEYGIIGVVIGGLGWFAKRQTSRLDEIQEKRILEGRESLQALNDSTRAMEALTDVVRATGGQS